MKFGFIGTGDYGSSMIKAAIKLSFPISQIYGHKNRDKLGNDLPYVESIDEVINNSDAIIVNTPPSITAEIGADCITNGKPCLLSKPVGHSSNETQVLLDMSNRYNIPVMAGHSLCYIDNIPSIFDGIYSAALVRHSRPPSTGKMNIYWNIGIHFIALFDILGIENYAIELLMSGGLDYTRQVKLLSNYGWYNLDLEGDITANELNHFKNCLESGDKFRTDVEHAVRVIKILEERYGSINIMKG